MTSRDTSDARIPSVPIEMPSDTAIVLNSTGVPPASRMPALTCSASARRCTLQGVTSVHVLATPTSGFSRSASVKPAPLSMARAGARAVPFFSASLRIGLLSRHRGKKNPRSLSGAGAGVRERVPQLGIPHPGRIRTSPMSATVPGATTTPARATHGRDGAADTPRPNIVGKTTLAPRRVKQYCSEMTRTVIADADKSKQSRRLSKAVSVASFLGRTSELDRVNRESRGCETASCPRPSPRTTDPRAPDRRRRGA